MKLDGLRKFDSALGADELKAQLEPLFPVDVLYTQFEIFSPGELSKAQLELLFLLFSPANAQLEDDESKTELLENFPRDITKCDSVLGKTKCNSDSFWLFD